MPDRRSMSWSSASKIGDEAFGGTYGQRGSLGIPRGNVHIASHTECFVYYVLNQRRDVWGGQVGMFSLSDEDLRYYELRSREDRAG